MEGSSQYTKARKFGEYRKGKHNVEEMETKVNIITIKKNKKKSHLPEPPKNKKRKKESI